MLRHACVSNMGDLSLPWLAEQIGLPLPAFDPTSGWAWPVPENDPREVSPPYRCVTAITLYTGLRSQTALNSCSDLAVADSCVLRTENFLTFSLAISRLRQVIPDPASAALAGLFRISMRAFSVDGLGAVLDLGLSSCYLLSDKSNGWRKRRAWEYG